MYETRKCEHWLYIKWYQEINKVWKWHSEYFVSIT